MYFLAGSRGAATPPVGRVGFHTVPASPAFYLPASPAFYLPALLVLLALLALLAWLCFACAANQVFGNYVWACGSLRLRVSPERDNWEKYWGIAKQLLKTAKLN